MLITNIYTWMKSILPTNQRGVTIIELVMATVIMAIIAMVLYPIMTAGVKSLSKVEEGSDYTREANGLWLYLRPLLANDGTITDAQSQSMSFTSSGNAYVLSSVVDGGTYDGVLTINGGDARLLVNNIAALSGPSRPGLEFVYLDREGVETSTPNRVKSVDVTLSLKGGTAVHIFQSRLKVEPRAMVIESL